MLARWRLVVFFVATLLILALLQSTSLQTRKLLPGNHSPPGNSPVSQPEGNHANDGKFDWSRIPHHYPVQTMRPLPAPVSGSIPKIQAANFAAESPAQKTERLQRLEAVKDNFTHAWTGYRDHAWLQDEVAPLSGRGMDPFGGWAATLVDSLDTLWIMGMRSEFEAAIAAVDQIDFTTCTLDEINVFETTIRYLGGFLSAYDLSDGKYPVLLRKAEEIGIMLYHAFDTPNRMPITRWRFKDAASGQVIQEAPDNMLVAEIGSLTLEFTRLSQLSKDPRYYDAVQRIMDIFDAQQDTGKLPGLWPVVVNPRAEQFNEHGGFTIGGMADSLYEYLPKQHLLLGGATNQYRRMYQKALIAMKRNIFFRPSTVDQKDILFPGDVDSDGTISLNQLQTKPRIQHLSCFAGGMVGLAARAFGTESDLETAKKLVEGCLWGYEATRNHILPEVVNGLPCSNPACSWDEQNWLTAMTATHQVEGLEATMQKQSEIGLPKGMVSAADSRYILRPEAIESVFILYRLTGDRSLQDRAWNMFNSIIRLTITDIAHAALDDCTAPEPPKADRMESFWMAETLKYFYLIFSDPDVVNLDAYVLNTEAHPLKRPA